MGFDFILFCFILFFLILSDLFTYFISLCITAMNHFIRATREHDLEHLEVTITIKSNLHGHAPQQKIKAGRFWPDWGFLINKVREEPWKAGHARTNGKARTCKSLHTPDPPTCTSLSGCYHELGSSLKAFWSFLSVCVPLATRVLGRSGADVGMSNRLQLQLHF